MLSKFTGQCVVHRPISITNELLLPVRERVIRKVACKLHHQCRTYDGEKYSDAQKVLDLQGLPTGLRSVSTYTMYLSTIKNAS